MAELSGELQDELVALVRDLHADHVKHGAHDYVQDFVARTAAIVAKLPDPDIAEARRLIGEAYGPTRYESGKLIPGDGPTRIEDIIAGKGDLYYEMRIVLAALKRGRELERAALSKAQGGAK